MSSKSKRKKPGDPGFEYQPNGEMRKNSAPATALSRRVKGTVTVSSVCNNGRQDNG